MLFISRNERREERGTIYERTLHRRGNPKIMGECRHGYEKIEKKDGKALCVTHCDMH